MGLWLLLFFTTPIIEMYLLIRVGGYIGAWPTIGLVMLTAVIGVFLLRLQGLATLTRGMSRLEGGELPAREVVEGLLLAVAGALLLTPGFATDGVGFLLLFPPTRWAVARWVLARVNVHVGANSSSRSGDRSHGWGSRSGDRSHRWGDGSHSWGDRSHSGRGRVIEGEFESRTEGEGRDDGGGDDDEAPRRRR